MLAMGSRHQVNGIQDQVQVNRLYPFLLPLAHTAASRHACPHKHIQFTRSVLQIMSIPHFKILIKLSLMAFDHSYLAKLDTKHFCAFLID